MGRPRIHHTEEARKAAARANSKVYYDKNKTKINRKRKRAYRKAHPERMKAVVVTSKSSSDAAEGLDSPDAAAAAWLDRSRRIPLRLEKYLGGRKPAQFFQDLCNQLISAEIGTHPSYIEDPKAVARQHITEHQAALAGIQTSANKYCTKLLQLSGFELRPELTEAREIARTVDTVAQCLQNIEIFALEDEIPFSVLIQNRKLMFQTTYML
ncbi:hypothetical protein DFP72DRAFT_840709 [Ephemerocybe angulata]|uniref:Uncharacterized protein n=1 Tax=Ephemerocybe angulata TaxID=980116 RepID=A0A8H6MCL3_9AGAR|nr:hypothetical protein DFP72DRAFT_840680 [Tulosesus angulatus]KAF6763550.1 hypothetical protein DFP72DRAFT_840709 [Tulosesus angulatus]